MRHRSSGPLPFDKYAYYKRAVQSPETDVLFFRSSYRELKGMWPKTLREDFCGTFAVCCEWVKLKKEHRAVAVDLDSEPLRYGQLNYYSKLKSDQQKRLKVLQKNVMSRDLPRADIINASNFSYYFFKEREQLKKYFKSCLKNLNRNGILVLDLFGGSLCQEVNEERSSKGHFVYYWHQESFDPITHEAVFNIHFKPKGGRKYKNVFSYDWRMWTIPEVRELLMDAGFSRTHVYWEGTNSRGEGDGEFKLAESGEECASWVAYVVAEK